jgi:hypothetical protein
MSMKNVTARAMVVFAVAALAGCEWEGADQGESLTQRYNWVSFSGVYRAATNGYLVAGFGDALQNTEETVATAVAGISSYNGVLDNGDVVPGSVQVNAGVFSLTDDGAGVLAGGGKSGTIIYDTGAWSINLLGEWPPGGTPIEATYRYGDASSPGSGGEPIYTLTVQQSGNLLTMIDNNGATYSGRIANIASSGGQSIEYPDTTTSLPANGDTLTASFEVEGRSSSGVEIKIVGTLTGTATVTAATATTPSTIRLATRTLRGTWIEANGTTGDMLGTAP